MIFIPCFNCGLIFFPSHLSVQGDKEISTEEVPRRILRSSSTQFTPEPAPIIPPKSHSTNININSKIGINFSN